MKMNKYEREKLQLRLLSLKKRRLAKTDSDFRMSRNGSSNFVFFAAICKEGRIRLKVDKTKFSPVSYTIYYFSHQGSPRIVSEEKVKFGASTLVVGHSMFRLRHSLVGRRRS